MIHHRYIDLNDGMKIPTMGFGTWRITNDEALAVISEALNCGYRSFDTAAMYGNEEGIGRALKNTDFSRAEISLTTKVWNSDHGYDATLRAMDASLKNLQTSYVDLYLIHWPSPKQDKYVPTWKALTRLRSEGLTKSIGVCNFEQEHIERLMNETGIVPAINQVELHPHFQQKKLREFHQRHGIVTEAWSPLARGQLFADKTILSLSQKYQKTPAQIVLRWHFDNGIIAIPKTSHALRMLENLDILDFHLDAEDLSLMSTIDDVNGRTGVDPMKADF